MVNKAKKKTEESSEANENLEVLAGDNKAEPLDLPVKIGNEQTLELVKKGLNVRKGGSVIIGTMNVMVDPLTKQLNKRHERFYKTSRFHVIADVILVWLVLASATIFLTVFTFQPKAQIDLQTSIDDQTVVSGQAETYTIQYANNGKVDIKNSTLSLGFPKNFVLMAVSPEAIWSDQTNTFKIGDLPRGANGKVKVTGIAYGELGARGNLAYSFNYLQNGRSGNLLGSYLFSLDSSVLETSFTAPKEIYQNLDFGGTITLENNGRADIEKEIDLSFANPAIVVKSIFSDQARLVNGAIIINGLKAGEEASIEYEASCNAQEGQIDAVLETAFNLSGQKSKQGEASRVLSVAVPKFSVVISADKTLIKSDELVNFKLNYANQEDSNIASATIAIMPADDATEIENLVLSGKSDKYKITGNTIALGDLKTGESGEIDFAVNLHRRAVSVNQQTGVLANINYQANGRPAAYQMFSPKIKFISDLQIISKGLYYSASGDQLGVGPLPPVVDVPTKYWIFWEINNSGNELKNLTVTADLPANVGWTNQQTVLAGDLRFGEASNKVVWTVADVAASGGNYRVGFEVELIPRLSDLGKVPTLVSNIRYSATDSFAGIDIVGSQPDINADIKDDPAASGKGKVVELKIVK